MILISIIVILMFYLLLICLALLITVSLWIYLKQSYKKLCDNIESQKSLK